MKKLQLLGAISLFISAFTTVDSSHAATLHYGGNGEVTSISELEVGTTTYNVTFHLGYSFLEIWDADGDLVFGEGDGSLVNHMPLFWNDQTNALLAATAIANALGSSEYTTGFNSTLQDAFWIPYEFDETNGWIWRAQDIWSAQLTNDVIGSGATYIDYDIGAVDFPVFASFEALPIPAGVSLSLIGGNFDLSSGLATNRQAPSVAYNSVDNEYLVVWNETTMTTTKVNVSGQRVSAVGTLLNDNIQVTNFMGFQVSPIVTHNNMDNEYFVVWKSQLDRPGSTDFNDAFGRRVSNNGVLLGDAFHIFDGGLGISSAYNGSNSSFNNQYLVTGRSFASGPVPGILGQMVSNSGSIVGSEIPIATAGGQSPNGQVVYNQNTNEYFATWRDQVERNLKGQRIAASGGLIGDAIVISPVFPESGFAASVAFDLSNDRYLVIFGIFQEKEILAQFVSSSGELIGSNFLIATGLLSRVNPYIAYSGIDNAFVVVWEEDGNIIGQLLSDDGIMIGDKLIVAQETGQFGSPRLAHNSVTGQFLVAWRDVRNVSQGEVDIFAQLIGITSDRLNVVVDINRNIINPYAKGGIWVTVLSDTDSSSPFDPSSQVDISSVEFGSEGAKAIRHKIKDKNQDGLGDLLLRFKTPDTGITCGDTEATLTGRTFDGEGFTGTDSVKTVGCKKSKKVKGK